MNLKHKNEWTSISLITDNYPCYNFDYSPKAEGPYYLYNKFKVHVVWLVFVTYIFSHMSVILKGWRGLKALADMSANN